MRAIGVFDSGYGGLTILKSITSVLPSYDFIYLGDNARAPYGTRSFETVYQYTWQAVQKLFAEGCPLVILACNTASAKALRTIQQKNLPQQYSNRRVLGVIRPTAEVIGNMTRSNTVGIMATKGTVASESYLLEIDKFYPQVKVLQQACPLFVPLIEQQEHLSPGMDYFLEKYSHQLMQQSDQIDTVLLACTHYPLIENSLKSHFPENVKIVSQGDIVAKSLVDYLKRHPEIDEQCTRNGKRRYFTTDDVESFDAAASLFYGESIQAEHIHLT
ncbi:glutamate racemase [Gynurincola endophyticus]|uniref:glutamate racemase n=1 Tax=Gynurincola endophyticus TaxID=2479004 RepID=UPI000F8F0C5A|nr:glutamate racemase [Gynurincola endophyticus]